MITEEQKYQLDINGYTVVEEVFSEETRRALIEALEEIFRRELERGRHHQDEQHRLTHNLPYKLPDRFDLFMGLIEHPRVLPLHEYLLGEGLILSSLNAREARPGCQAQALHPDHSTPNPALNLVSNSIWMLDDFTPANGATRVVPGSHKYSALPQPGHIYPGETTVTGKAGSVLVYNAFLWHGSTPNTDGKNRRGIFGYFTRPFCKQQYDTTRGCPPQIFARLTPRQKHLLGFDSVSRYED